MRIAHFISGVGTHAAFALIRRAHTHKHLGGVDGGGGGGRSLNTPGLAAAVRRSHWVAHKHIGHARIDKQAPAPARARVRIDCECVPATGAINYRQNVPIDICN